MSHTFDQDAPEFKYDKDGQRLERIVMEMPDETETAIDAAALHAGRTRDEQLVYIMKICMDHHCPDGNDPRTREDWLRLFETIEFVDDDGDGGCVFVTVRIPAEIATQMVEAQPSIYDPELVERVKWKRIEMKRKGVIPQLEEEPDRMAFAVGLGSKLEGAVSTDARGAGRTIAEQIQYEIEVNHGWRFPDPGDTRFEERIRMTYTLREWLNLYLRFHVRFIGSSRNAAHMALNYFGPLLSTPPSKLSRPAVMQWAQAIGQRYPSAAMNAVERLCNMYSKATDWNLYEGKNPAAKCRLFPKSSRSRFLQTEEITRLLQALEILPPSKATFFLTLLLTGARCGEAARMQWAHLDLVQGVWYKPTTKSGTSHTVPLPQALTDRLLQLPKDGPFVFHGGHPTACKFPHCNGDHTGTKPDAPWSRTAIFFHWRKIRQLAGLPDVRIHDLRRTTGSWLASHGTNIAVIQKVLNHSQLATTAIYARMNLAPVREALEDNAGRMLALGRQAVPNSILEKKIVQPVDESDMEWPG